MKKPALLSILSGSLLALSFPHPGWDFFAWFALVPLLYAVRSAQTPGRAFGYGALFGAVFFGVSMHWLTRVTAVGWILLVLVQSLYTALFAWLVYYGKKTDWPVVCKVLWTAAAWTLMEFARSEVPVFGFGWNLLAFSQAGAPVAIQVANAIGAYGLGFFMAAVNVCVAKLFLKEKQRPRGAAAALFSAVLVIAAGTYAYGEWTLAKKTEPPEFLRLAVTQGNIPQSLKWAPVAKEKILAVYAKLTELSALDDADLVIWPEAAFPGYFNRDVQGPEVATLARTLAVPLLVGGVHREGDSEVYNSAYFIDKTGATGQRYDKLRLVPFGEYIPFKPVFFWLEPVADDLGIGDFLPGKQPVIFRWAREEWPFGVLICFEDVVPALARELADRGAKFIAVITNDAWFEKTAAPFQHFQASVFRAVENGVPVVRAANTGVSGMISCRGEVLETVKGEKGEEIFVAGRKVYDLPLFTKDTVYRKGGWAFPYLVATLFVGLGIFLIRKLRTAE